MTAVKHCKYDDILLPDGDGCGCTHPLNETKVCPNECITGPDGQRCPMEEDTAFMSRKKMDFEGEPL